MNFRDRRDLPRQCIHSCGLIAAMVLVLASASGFYASAKPAPSAKAKKGDLLFHQHCVSCHNKQPGDTSPFGPPNLHGIFSDKPLVNPPITPVEARKIIREGKSPMPPFGNVLSDSQISALIAYLKTQ